MWITGNMLDVGNGIKPENTVFLQEEGMSSGGLDLQDCGAKRDTLKAAGCKIIELASKKIQSQGKMITTAEA